MPGDAVELAAVARERGLLDRHLVDEPFHQVPPAYRIRDGADEGARVKFWRGAAQRGPQRVLLGDRRRDSGLPADEFGYFGERHRSVPLTGW